MQTRPSIETRPAAADNKTMRLRFWFGFGLVAAIAVGSITLALVVQARESDSFEKTQRGEATRAAHQAEALAGLSVGQLASAVAFYQAEGTFNRHEFDVIADSLLKPGALTATAYIRSVPREARARFERSHGFPIPRTRPAGGAAQGHQSSPLLPTDIHRRLGPVRAAPARL